MFTGKWIRTIILTWLAWALIVIGFQSLVAARLQLQRPDFALDWTPSETTAQAQDDHPYLLDPFMNHQVSWDSEYYLSIAIAGYDDTTVQTAPPPWRPDLIRHEPVSLNYAFFPFYPFLIRIFSIPLRILPMTPIARATLAGVVVSLLGTLGAMFALFDLTREWLDDESGLRAAFYLIVFPSGFFLAQVYTEGLFIGLAFGSLAVLRHRKWWWAGVLAVCATWTRAVGITLIIPLGLAWVKAVDWDQVLASRFDWKALAPGLVVLAPLFALWVWWFYNGEQFRFVEEAFFGRESLQVMDSLRIWLRTLSGLNAANTQSLVYYVLEIVATLLAIVACGSTFREEPGLTLFGLAVIAVSFFSAVPQGMLRYVLAVPSLFIMLARWGRHAAFDRVWTTASVLLMGLSAMLYTFDFWVA